MSRPIRDERDSAWVAYLAANEAKRQAVADVSRLAAEAEAYAAAEAELDRLLTRAAIPDLTALRDARIGDWRAEADRHISRNPATGAWTITHEMERTA